MMNLSLFWFIFKCQLFDTSNFKLIKVINYNLIYSREKLFVCKKVSFKICRKQLRKVQGKVMFLVTWTQFTCFQSTTKTPKHCVKLAITFKINNNDTRQLTTHFCRWQWTRKCCLVKLQVVKRKTIFFLFMWHFNMILAFDICFWSDNLQIGINNDIVFVFKQITVWFETLRKQHHAWDFSKKCCTNFKKILRKI